MLTWEREAATDGFFLSTFYNVMVTSFFFSLFSFFKCFSSILRLSWELMLASLLSALRLRLELYSAFLSLTSFGLTATSSLA